MRAVAGADMRIAIVEVELPELHDRVMEELRIGLRIEEGRGLVVFETVLLGEIWRRVRRGNIRVSLTWSSPVTSEIGHVSPFTALARPVCGAGVEGRMSRVSGRGECALIDVRRGMWTRCLLVVHCGQQMRWCRRMRLSGGHLVHQVGGVD